MTARVHGSDTYAAWKVTMLLCETHGLSRTRTQASFLLLAAAAVAFAANENE